MIQIILESKDKNTSEATFLNAFLDHIKVEIPLIEEVSFLYANGKDNLHNIVNELKKITDNGGKNLLIFDADTVNNMGGFASRKNEIIEKKETLGVEFEIFLFPNNKDDGDFESLIEEMIPVNHQPIKECFRDYELCICGIKDEDDKCICDGPIRKSMIYSYIDSLKKSKEEKKLFKGVPHDYFFYNPKYWNLDHEYAQPLKDFLLEHLS